MAFTPVERMQIKNAVERILHAPGNYRGGILEMAMVFDCNLPEEYIKQMGRDIAALLKSHSEIFRNVRLNIICWETDEKLVKEMSSLPHLQMGSCFAHYKHTKSRKRWELLAEQLKKFYARSKLIILLTDGDYFVGDTKLFDDSLRPFLYRKLMVIRCLETEDAEPKSAVPAKDMSVLSGISIWKINGETGETDETGETEETEIGETGKTEADERQI